MPLIIKKFLDLKPNKIKIQNIQNLCSLVFYSKRKTFLKIRFTKNIVFSNTKFFIFSSLPKNNYITLTSIIENFLKKDFFNIYSNFSKIYMIGLGFKNFILNGKLYILVGDCNYLIFNIPENLKVICKKNQIYVMGLNNCDILNFVSNIKKIKKSNFYKGKGVLEFKNFKFTKLKVGKKQRFM